NATAGGARGAASADGGATWTPFRTAPAVTGTTAPQSGMIAVAADGSTLLWAPQGGRTAAVTPGYSRDMGATWKASMACNNGPCRAPPSGSRAAADRVTPAKFYASTGNRMYVSTDGGATFTAAGMATTGRPRPVFGIEGDLWVPTGTGLLHSTDSGATF